MADHNGNLNAVNGDLNAVNGNQNPVVNPGVWTYDCNVCKKVCTTYKGFESHRKIHKQKYPFECLDWKIWNVGEPSKRCASMFITQADLTVHQDHEHRH